MDRRYKKRINRYWREMELKGLKALARVDIHEWFDLWHTHPDWERKGNKRLENRRSAIELGYKLLQAAEALCVKRAEPIECWVSVCQDTGDNGVYLHTKNPNGTPFPSMVEGIEWNPTDNQVLNDVVDHQVHEIGKYHFSGEVVYVVRKRA
jgi:hypothetical protein